jgi:group I intron endonuclease
MDLALRQLMTNDTPHINEVIDSSKLNGKTIGVYMLMNKETNKVYIGSGVISRRKSKHLVQLKNNNHFNAKLQNAFNVNPNFEFSAIKTETREIAYDIEQKLIDDFHNSDFLLNIAVDARYSTSIVSEETREKLRQFNLGKKHSEETKAKMSASRMGHPVSQLSLDRLIERNKTQIISDETREKMRQTKLGNKASDETKAKMSLAQKGRIVTEEDKLVYKQSIKCQEVLEKMRLSNIGRGKSPETVAKMLKTRQENKLLKLNTKG